MENKKDEGYIGIWKHIGCFLTLLVGFVFLAVVVAVLNMIFHFWNMDF